MQKIVLLYKNKNNWKYRQFKLTANNKLTPTEYKVVNLQYKTIQLISFKNRLYLYFNIKIKKNMPRMILIKITF